jgi:fucose permease
MTLTFTEKLGEMLNKLHSAFGVGALVGPLLLSLVLSVLHDALGAFMIGMILAILALVFLIFMRLPTPVPTQATQPTTQQAATKARPIFTQLALWLIALQLFLYVGGEVSFGGWITSALSQAATISLAEAAPAATLFWLGLTLGRLMGGQILKRAWLSEKALLYLCFFGGFVSGLFAAIFIGNIWIAFAGSLCIGIFCAPVFPGVMAIASRRFADTLGSASSVILVGSGSSGFVFPPLVGVVLTHVGIGWSLLIPALLLLSIALPFVLVKPEASVATA